MALHLLLNIMNTLCAVCWYLSFEAHCRLEPPWLGLYSLKESTVGLILCFSEVWVTQETGVKKNGQINIFL